MQKLLLLLITIIICLSSSAVILKGKSFRGYNEKSETKTFNLSSFNTVKASQSIEVEIVKSAKEKAVATSTHMPELIIEVKDKTLFIRYKPNVSLQNVTTKVVVSAKDLVKAEAESASFIKVKDIFSNAEQAFECRTAGKIYADSQSAVVNISTENAGQFSGKIDVKELNVDINSAGIVTLNGSADHANIKANSASSLDAENLRIKTAKASAGSASTVTVSVSKELTVEATSLAKIKYRTLSGIRFSATRKSGGTIDSF